MTFSENKMESGVCRPKLLRPALICKGNWHAREHTQTHMHTRTHTHMLPRPGASLTYPSATRDST